MILLDSFTKDVQQEMKKNYLSLAELLRHFWSCFPIKTPQLEEKVRFSSYNLYWFCFAVFCRGKLVFVHVSYILTHNYSVTLVSEMLYCIVMLVLKKWLLLWTLKVDRKTPPFLEGTRLCYILWKEIYFNCKTRLILK